VSSPPYPEMHVPLPPYSAAFLLPAAPAAQRRIASALEVEDAAAGIAELAREGGTPGSLGELGMSEDDVVRVAAAAEPELPELPRKPTLAQLEDLLLRAVRGTPTP